MNQVAFLYHLSLHHLITIPSHRLHNLHRFHSFSYIMHPENISTLQQTNRIEYCCSVQCILRSTSQQTINHRLTGDTYQ